MVDDEIELRPILGCLEQVPWGLVLPNARPALFVIRRHQSLVNAHGPDARLIDLFVEGVHQLFVVEPERVLRLGRQRVADGVQLPTGWRTFGERLVHLVHPAGLPGGDDRMTQHARAARGGVDHVHRFVICSLGRIHHDGSSKGAPLNTATEVSLLRKICLT